MKENERQPVISAVAASTSIAALTLPLLAIIVLSLMGAVPEPCEGADCETNWRAIFGVTCITTLLISSRLYPNLNVASNATRNVVLILTLPMNAILWLWFLLLLSL